MPTDTTLPPLDPFDGVPDKRYEVKAADLLKPGSGGILRWRRQAGCLCRGAFHRGRRG